MDWDGPLPDREEPMEECVSVEVPETRNPLSHGQLQELLHRVNPLRISNSYGIDIYLEVVSFVVNSLSGSEAGN